MSQQVVQPEPASKSAELERIRQKDAVTAQQGPVKSAMINVPNVTVQAKRSTTIREKVVEWHGKKDVRVKERFAPEITDPNDAIIKITSTAICGSDLHLYTNAMPGMKSGDVLGHEFMGTVFAVGPGVKNVQVGQRVVVSFCISCGQCPSCQRGLPSSCDASNPSEAQEKLYGHRSGGFFGYTHLTGGWEGGQGEYARVPFADCNLLPVPDNLTDEQCIPLADNLPTAWFGCEMAAVSQGDVVAIWGCGPVGLLTAHVAFHLGASRVIMLDTVAYRLEFAHRKLPKVETIDVTKQRVFDTLKAMCPLGPDVSIECVGMHYSRSLLHRAEVTLGLETDPSDILNEIIECTRKGGRIAIVGAYAGYCNHFNIGAFMEKGLAMKGGQAPVQRYWSMLLDKVVSGALDPTIVMTHLLPLDDAPLAYRTFNDKTDGVMKVVLKTAFASKPAEGAGRTTEGGTTSGTTTATGTPQVGAATATILSGATAGTPQTPNY